MSRPPRRTFYSPKKRSSPELSRKTAELVRLFEDHLAIRSAPRTVTTYMAHLQVFLSWLAARGLELISVRSSDVEAYASDLFSRRKADSKPYSIGFLVHRLVSVRMLFRFLYRRGYLLADAAASVELPREESRLPRVLLSRDEVRRILAAPDTKTPRGLRDRAILETFYACGIRVGELIRLGLEDVDTEEQILRVILGKGRKDRVVPLTRAAAAAIEAYLVNGRGKLLGTKPRPNVFLGGFGFPLTRGAVSQIIQHWARKARVKKHVTPHTLRHTVATHLLRGRADIRHIQALLGHESLATTQRYTKVEVTDLRRVIERAHPRGK